ncbi:MAG: hypothetical protein R3E10_15045 [Gemmatimonadota bacterium]
MWNPQTRSRTLARASAWVALALAGGCSDATGPVVPVSLQAAGHHAESVYEQVFSDQWSAAKTFADSLAQDLDDMDRQGVAATTARAELRTSFAGLDAALITRERFVALDGANEMTRVVAELTEMHHPSVPTEITLLDYYGRVLQIQSERDDRTALATGVDGLRLTWDAVRAKVVARPQGAAAAADFDALVLLAESTAEPTAFADLSVRILDAVDVLEQLFPASDAPD